MRKYVSIIDHTNNSCRLDCMAFKFCKQVQFLLRYTHYFSNYMMTSKWIHVLLDHLYKTHVTILPP